MPARSRFPRVSVGAPSPGDGWAQGSKSAGSQYSNPDSVASEDGEATGYKSKPQAKPTPATDTGYATSRVNEPDAPAYKPAPQAPAPAPQVPAAQAPVPVTPAATSSALALGALPWRTIGYAAGGVAIALLLGYGIGVVFL